MIQTYNLKLQKHKFCYDVIANTLHAAPILVYLVGVRCKTLGIWSNQRTLPLSTFADTKRKNSTTIDLSFPGNMGKVTTWWLMAP